MFRRLVPWLIAVLIPAMPPVWSFSAPDRPPSKAQPAHAKQAETKNWNISSTASTIAQWLSDITLGRELDIQTIVLSVREDGVFLNAGSNGGVTVGQVFEIYRAAHERIPEEVAGRVRVVWTRDDYCFAAPVGNIDLTLVSSLHFARIIHVPPTLKIVSDLSLGGDEAKLGNLIDATKSLLIPRSINVIVGDSREPAWLLVLTPDHEGQSISASLLSPGGEVAGTILVSSETGRRLSNEAWLDQSYLDGGASPFEHYLAPPGRRSVRIASGNLVPGNADELAVLDGSDLYVYDLSGAEPRLLNSFSVSIPPAPVRHREDMGSLEVIDLDGNGLDEVCIAPPGGSRGEVWTYSNQDWVSLGFLSLPPHAVSPQTGAVLTGGYLTDVPALNSATLAWAFPLTQKEAKPLALNFSPVAVASLPVTEPRLPDLLAVNRNGTLYRVVEGSEPSAFTGVWGNCVRVAGYKDGTLAFLTRPSFRNDSLTLMDIATGNTLQEFPYPDGPIVDIAIGDIDKDGRSEILVAAIHPEGVRIYY